MAAESRQFDLSNRLMNFSCMIVDVVDSIPQSLAGMHIAKQLIRSGTSPMANYAEAHGAESKKDFVHKMKIALKELRETQAWLGLIKHKQLSNNFQLAESCKNECNQLVAIFQK